MLGALETLAREYTYVGFLPQELYKSNLTAILRAIPQDSQVFIILAKEYYGDAAHPGSEAKPQINLNRWTREVAAEFEYVHTVLITDFMADASELRGNHFDRMVYFRMFKHIQNEMQATLSVRFEPTLGERRLEKAGID